MKFQDGQSTHTINSSASTIVVGLAVLTVFVLFSIGIALYIKAK